MKRSIPVLLLACLAVPSISAAQQAQESRFTAARFAPITLAGAVGADGAMAVPVTDRRARTAEHAGSKDRQERSVLSTVLHTLGGAVVGGWVGFVGSQVTLSDWEKETNSSFSSERRAWVAAGMVVGALGSRIFGATTAPGREGVEIQRPRSERNVLTRADIEAAGASTVYDLVATLRRDWLVTRGVNSIRETARGTGSGMGSAARMTVQPGQAGVVVYMDDIRLGAVEKMRELLTNDIMEIEFIEPQAAAYRYGAGHSHGVILLRTSL